MLFSFRKVVEAFGFASIVEQRVLQTAERTACNTAHPCLVA